MAKPSIHEGPHGGLFFFFSLLCLVVISVSNVVLVPPLIGISGGEYWLAFGMAFLLGATSAALFIRGHISVLLHELKHSIVSNLVGNRAKGLKVEADSGHFEYEFTKDTAHHNATIALAPYWLPLATVLFAAGSLPWWHSDHKILVASVGFGYGIDLVTNLRDFSPQQSDIFNVRGGLLSSFIYIAAMNITIATLLAVWVPLGSAGVVQLFQIYGELALGRIPVAEPPSL